MENGSLQCLPERSSELIEVHLDKDEMDVYQKIMIFSRTLFSVYLHQRTEKQNDSEDSNKIQTHQILVLLLRLRQICCHPGLIDAVRSDDLLC